MIPVPSGIRVWLAVGRNDIRRGMNGLALRVQEASSPIAPAKVSSAGLAAAVPSWQREPDRKSVV